jgi:hypothetical protein
MTNQYWADASTQNCVWLFRIMRKVYSDNGCTCDIYDEEGELLEGKTDENCNCFTKVWETHRVFLTRKEARAFGESRPYAWGKENERWDIYGVPADGIIVEILGKHNKEFESEVEYITKRTSEDILKEVRSFGYGKYKDIDEIVKEAIALTREACEKRGFDKSKSIMENETIMFEEGQKAEKENSEKRMSEFRERILEIIDNDLVFQKKQLKGDFEKDKPTQWRITGFESLKKEVLK